MQAMPKTATTMQWDAKGASHHLGYEIQMFFGMVSLLRAWAKLSNPGMDGNAFLESFVIHLRNLVDFFFPRPNSRSTDITVGNFFEGSGKSWVPPAGSFLLQDAAALQKLRKRADREIAHLTLHRLYVAPAEKPWDREKLASEIHLLVTEFVKQVPQIDSLDKDFLATLKDFDLR
jgi:hypothetical protein